ncbi:hypothetical protein [Sulfurimonas sp.]|uniref:hypothetical protein n=1 Tax=Sulfurimonas sp. TaxID=2022749 RepID=UPI0025E9CCA2|nr:hypothetical protein [Sulfurimonas sp.]MBW6487466.1 hypothetical protein [Sulfurimonas sp.]
MYKFPEGLYPLDITYHYSRSLFNFFQTNEQTKEFFKYLFSRLNEEYKRRKKGENVCAHVLKNDSDKYPLVDLNYNFFVLVLAEWIEYYSCEDRTVYEYSKYKKIAYKKTDKESGEEKNVVYNQKRDLKIECSTKERVLFDYSFSGWLTTNRTHKNFRFDLMQILLNNILGKHTFIPNYNYRNKAVTVKNILVFDEKKNTNMLFAATSFFRSTLANYYSNSQMNLLREMSGELQKLGYKKMSITDDDEFEIDGKIVQVCSYFDIKNIEKNRDQNDGQYYDFEPKEKGGSENKEMSDDVDY